MRDPEIIPCKERKWNIQTEAITELSRFPTSLTSFQRKIHYLLALPKISRQIFSNWTSFFSISEVLQYMETGNLLLLGEFWLYFFPFFPSAQRFTRN